VVLKHLALPALLVPPLARLWKTRRARFPQTTQPRTPTHHRAEKEGGRAGDWTSRLTRPGPPWHPFDLAGGRRPVTIILVGGELRSGAYGAHRPCYLLSVWGRV